jgi:hypothetical protein
MNSKSDSSRSDESSENEKEIGQKFQELQKRKQDPPLNILNKKRKRENGEEREDDKRRSAQQKTTSMLLSDETLERSETLTDSKFRLQGQSTELQPSIAETFFAVY